MRAGVEAVSARRWCDEFKVVIVLISPSGGKKEKEIGVVFLCKLRGGGKSEGREVCSRSGRVSLS